MSLLDPKILSRIKEIVPSELPVYTFLDQCARPQHPYVVYQTEDLEIPHKLQGGYPDLLKGATEVYDYSLANLQFWDSVFVPYLARRLPPVVEANNKILFYGGVSPRRQQIIHKMRQAGLDITILDRALYGADLANEITNYGHILSLGFYNNIHNDALRVIPALELGVRVLCEKVQEKWFNGYLESFSDRVTFFEVTQYE